MTKGKAVTAIMKMRNKIFINPMAQAQIDNWVKICPQEISGLGTVELTPEGHFYVDQVYLLDQEVSASETELDEEAVIKLMASLPPAKQEKLRFWWHSHVNMGVFWSSVDHACMQKLRSTVTDFLVSIVYNKKGEQKARVDVMSPFCDTHFDDQPVYLDVMPDYLFNRALNDIFDKPDDTLLKCYYDIAQVVNNPKLKPWDKLVGSQTIIQDLTDDPEEQIEFLEGFGELASFDAMAALRKDFMEYCQKQYKEKVRLSHSSYSGKIGSKWGAYKGYTGYTSPKPSQRISKKKGKKHRLPPLPPVELLDDDNDDYLEYMTDTVIDFEDDGDTSFAWGYNLDKEDFEWDQKDIFDN